MASKKELPQLAENTERIAVENVCVHQVINSIFEHVTNEPNDRLQHRSDQAEITKFSNEIIEGELIFGSPDEDVLEKADAHIDSKLRKNVQASNACQ